MYGVAMQISSSEKEAELILIHAFKKLQRQKLNNHNLTCVSLLS